MNRSKFAEDNSMEGKTCLVTGASRRIDFQTALGLARKHALIVLAGHNRQLGEKAGRLINAYIMRKATDSILLQPLIWHAHAAGQDGSNENQTCLIRRIGGTRNEGERRNDCRVYAQ